MNKTNTKKPSRAAARLHNKTLLMEQAEASVGAAERLHAIMQVGYKAAVVENDPAQIVLLDLMQDAAVLQQKLENLHNIVKARGYA